MNPELESIKTVLMRRDKLSEEGALELIADARTAWNDGEFVDPEDLLSEYFGLEPDYLFDIDLGLF